MYSVTDNTPSGSLERTIISQDEFYNGEFSGSTLLVEDGELNPDNPVKYQDITGIAYRTSGSAASINPEDGEIIWKARSSTQSSVVEDLYYVEQLVINEIDQSGTDSKTAIQNLKAGDEITFTINYTGIIPPP